MRARASQHVMGHNTPTTVDEGKYTATTFVGDDALDGVTDERFYIRDRGLEL
jgi:hypothetical protein